MKTTRGWFTGALGLFLATAVLTQAAEGWTEYRARPGAGSKIIMDGTANILHKEWKVRGLNIGGTLEVGPNFPTDPASAKPGKVDAKSTVFIPVRSLKSIYDDGRPYMASMDDIMYQHLKMEEHRNIDFVLSSFTLKEAKPDGTFLFDAEGELKVAGVAKNISMPIEMTAPEENRLRFSGNVDVKMTDFGISPPAPNIAGGMIKTGDEIKLTFEWVVAKR